MVPCIFPNRNPCPGIASEILTVAHMVQTNMSESECFKLGVDPTIGCPHEGNCPRTTSTSVQWDVGLG